MLDKHLTVHLLAPKPALSTCAVPVLRAPVSVASHPCLRRGRKETLPTSRPKASANARNPSARRETPPRRSRPRPRRPIASGRYRRRSPSTRFVDVRGFGSRVSTHRHAGGETAFALAFTAAPRVTRSIG
jgi:hypothetical protein